MNVSEYGLFMFQIHAKFRMRISIDSVVITEKSISKCVAAILLYIKTLLNAYHSNIYYRTNCHYPTSSDANVKNVKIKIHKTTVLSAVLHECDN